MSDIELDANCQNAIDSLMGAEESTRVALMRLEFRYFSEFGIEKVKSIEEIEAMMRAGMAETEETEGAAAAAAAPVRVSDRDTEERMVIEEKEDLFGRRFIVLEEAETFRRLAITATAFELSLLIDEAFKPCFSMAYKYPWDVNDYRLLPIKPHALDKVKNPERHIPAFMRKEAVAQLPAAQRLALADHHSAYQATLDGLKEPAPPLIL